MVMRRPTTRDYGSRKARAEQEPAPECKWPGATSQGSQRRFLRMPVYYSTVGKILVATLMSQAKS